MTRRPNLNIHLWRYIGLVIKCWCLVLVIRIFLSITSYKTILKQIQSVRRSPKNNRHPLLFVRAVKRASRFVPKASCLTQALAVKWLMARANQDCTLRIGVSPDPKTGMKAHAWVIHDGAVIIGGDEENFSTFRPITDL